MPPQLLLQDCLLGATCLAPGVYMVEKDGFVTYFLGEDNFFSHRCGDNASYRLALALLMHNGHVRPCELKRSALHIPHRTLMNWLRQYRERGADSFYRLRSHSSAPVMNADKVAQCEQLLSSGLSVGATAREAGIGDSALRKALKRGAVRRLSQEEFAALANPVEPSASNKSERSRADAQAAQGMGTACTRCDERMMAALGLIKSVTARFARCDDVMMGGLLAGLPALCANGLLSGIGKHLSLPGGFYSCLHIVVLLGFMALGRIRRPEGLRHVPPGELGIVMGLDRVPEVRTLRKKITVMTQTGHPEAWMKELSCQWMEDDPEEAGYLYVDGHVRVYHGSKANLPRRYVSRERLCLRGATDYWINDALGRPFFVVSKTVTEGLGATLMDDIVPQLLASVPHQPSQQALDQDPLLHRFAVIFDREGASHSLLSALWQHRIAAITYRKNVADQWEQSEFEQMEMPVPGGGTTRMMLAQRETAISASGRSIPVTEVRRLTKTGHQTAIISTGRTLPTVIIAGRMFARWCQENFFAYMMQHYDIDGLVQYGAQDIPGTVQVVNPAWRAQDKAVRQTRRELDKLLAQLGKLHECEPEDKAAYKKAELFETIEEMKAVLEQQRLERKRLKRKVAIESLPEAQRPTQLVQLNKTLTDTIKMIAYRAETALVGLLSSHLNKEEEARALVRQLLVSAADIIPDPAENILTVRIHRMACPAHDNAIQALLETLNEMEFRHPETNARMVYTLA